MFHLNTQPKPAQSEVIGAIWEASGPRDVLLSAAGSHPGDLHKLWRTRTPNGYHLEYGYSTMGYEIPGAMGAKLANPSREVAHDVDLTLGCDGHSGRLAGDGIDRNRIVRIGARRRLDAQRALQEVRQVLEGRRAGDCEGLRRQR